MPARQHRVIRGDEYRRVVRSGRRVGGAFCTTHAVSHVPGAPVRFGFIISKAVGGAVTRNRVRRRMKTIADRHIQAGLDGFDIVFRAKPAAATAEFQALENELNRAIAKLVAQRARGDQK